MYFNFSQFYLKFWNSNDNPLPHKSIFLLILSSGNTFWRIPRNFTKWQYMFLVSSNLILNFPNFMKKMEFKRRSLTSQIAIFAYFELRKRIIWNHWWSPWVWYRVFRGLCVTLIAHFWKWYSYMTQNIALLKTI